jgi:hypothetical protein
LADIAIVDGFLKNEGGRRAFRIGVDVESWLSHSTSPDFNIERNTKRRLDRGLPPYRKGENMDLQNIFWKCLALLDSPFIPIIVSSKKWLEEPVFGTTNQDIREGIKQILDAFGYAWKYVSLEDLCSWVY